MKYWLPIIKENMNWETIFTMKMHLFILIHNENAFIHLDPPYLDSWNAGYSQYENSVDIDANIIIITQIRTDVLNNLINSECKCRFQLIKFYHWNYI